MINDLKHSLKKPLGQLFAPKDATEIILLKKCLMSCKLASKKCLEIILKGPALICVECAEVCDFFVKFLVCNSEFSSQIMKLFKLICERCEEECLKIDFEECRQCAKECRRCLDYFSTPKLKRTV